MLQRLFTSHRVAIETIAVVLALVGPGREVAELEEEMIELEDEAAEVAELAAAAEEEAASEDPASSG